MDVETGDYVREMLDFAGVRLALRIDREVRDSNGVVTLKETRYFVSSLDPNVTFPAALLSAARAHWQVENSLHFVKDRWWDEDRHYTKRPGVAEALTALTNMALTLLRLSGLFEAKLPVRGRADRLASKPLLALEVLAAPPGRTTEQTDRPSAEPTTPK